MLLKTAFSSLLVLLVGCEHRDPLSVNATRPPTVTTAEATSAPPPTAAQDTRLATPRSSIAERDPSNPAAPEGAKAPSSADAPPMAPVDELAPHQHHAHDHGAQGTSTPDAGSADSGAAEAVYACPMHPAVTSSTPGRCPECGMNLVQKK
jgi:hypothetical protein